MIGLCSFGIGLALRAHAAQQPEVPSPRVHLLQADAIPLPVTREVCDKAAAQVGATSCSVVTPVSGELEGCECRVEAASCPDTAVDGLDFEGVSPSMPFSLPEMGGITVVLCTYWRWPPAPEWGSRPGGRAAAEVERLTERYVEFGRARALASLGPPPDVAAPPAASPAPAAALR
mmetsp:Transcript_58784/g.182604  ORF Transcript_58784/g.182604 Transcript_58784/m.182604 type:complete len:175 (-) Transcript_58784:43-567(-)